MSEAEDQEESDSKEEKKPIFCVYDVEPLPPTRPFNRSFMVETATVEGVRKKMESNGGAVWVACDELTGFLNEFNQHNRANEGVDRSFWTKTYDGENARILTAGKPETVIPRATASITGAIQTEVFERDILKKQSYLESGFLARFLCVEVEYVPHQKGKEGIPNSVKDNMQKVVEYLCSMRWLGCEPGKPPQSKDRKPVEVLLDSEAYGLFEDDMIFYDK